MQVGGRGKAMGEAKRAKVHVDRERCQGHVRCNALAPELFALDE
jgi:ferredoxin